MSMAIDRHVDEVRDTVVQVLLVDGWHKVEYYEEYEESYVFAGGQTSEWWFRADEQVDNEPFSPTGYLLSGPRSSVLALRSE